MKGWDENLRNDAVFFIPNARLGNPPQTLQIQMEAMRVVMTAIMKERKSKSQRSIEKLLDQKRRFPTRRGIMHNVSQGVSLTKNDGLASHKPGSLRH